MTTFSCIPLLLHPPSKIGFRSCEVVPGVKLQRIDKSLKKYIDTFSDKLPHGSNPDFVPSHVILIELKRYIDELEQRIAKEGKRLPEHPRGGAFDNFDRSVFLTDREAIVRHLIMSLVLLGLSGFQVAGVHGLDIRGSGANKEIRGRSYSHQPSRGNFRTHNYGLMPTSPSPIQARTLKQTAAKLERYYRSGTWWDDRLGRAFGHFWNTLCTPFIEQTFIGLAMTVEAALSTGSQELTHQLAERTALVVERDPEERYKTYKKIKELYHKIRGKLIHGTAGQKKGQINIESLSVTARHAFVPHSQCKTFMSLTIDVLNALLRDQEYLKINHTRGKTDDKVNELFIRRLLSD